MEIVSVAFSKEEYAYVYKALWELKEMIEKTPINDKNKDSDIKNIITIMNRLTFSKSVVIEE